MTLTTRFISNTVHDLLVLLCFLVRALNIVPPMWGPPCCKAIVSRLWICSSLAESMKHLWSRSKRSIEFLETVSKASGMQELPCRFLSTLLVYRQMVTASRPIRCLQFILANTRATFYEDISFSLVMAMADSKSASW